ncbi:TRADD-N-associated membrane domain-containing protein, partial [Streptomyces palmae]
SPSLSRPQALPSAQPFESAPSMEGEQPHGARPHQHVVISGSSVVNVVGSAHAPAPPPAATGGLTARRQDFFFSFLGQALTQAETTFRLSAVFMSAGALMVLLGAGLALANAGDPNASYLPALTSLSGALIGTCGGAFALHSGRARRHLTVQAERVHESMQADLTLDQTLSLIDGVEDHALRDRLKSVTALRVLGLGPDPETAASRLLPLTGDPDEGIAPGGPFP